MGQPGQTSLSERLRSIEAEIAAGQAESALAHCQDIFARYPRALAVQRVLGEIYLALRKPREALGALDRALAGDPEDARACCARAIIHQMHGDPAAALSWYRRACDARPDDPSLRVTYREMATRLGRPAYQPTRVGLARLYMRGAHFTHAIREWETLIAENSDLLEAQVGLVETLWRIERTHDAEDWARRVLMNAPSAVKPLLIVGVITRDTNRATEAARYLQRAAELDPDNRIARTLFADRAMEDSALRTLFWGDDPVVESPSQRPSFGPQATAATGSSRASFGPQRQTASQAVGQMMGQSTMTGQPVFGAPAYASMPPLSGAPSFTDLGAALSRPDLTANLARPLAPPAQPQNLPPEFHSMFKETENMLWGPDHSDPGAGPTMAMPTPPGQSPQAAAFMPPGVGSQGDVAPIPPMAPAPTMPPTLPPMTPPMAAPPSGRLGQPPFDSSTQFVPPAIAESQFALGDTETRRAIRWVQWLQAQGARMRSNEAQRGRPTGSLDTLFGSVRPEPPSGATPGTPPPYPFGGRASQLPVTSLPNTGPTGLNGFSGFNESPSGPSVPPQRVSQTGASAPASGPLSNPAPGPSRTSEPLPSPQSTPSPNAEELRQMFAQLEPAAPPNDSALTDFASAFAEPEHANGEPGEAPAPSERLEPLEPSTPDMRQNAWPEALAEAFEWPSQPGASSPGAGAPAQPGARRAANSQPGPDLTLEALEGVHSASGYAPFTLEPGALAAFTDHPSAAPASEKARALDEFFQEPEQPPLAAAEPAPAEPATAAAQPAPTDYPARLAAARSLREDGALDEALVEYGALLRNAPDLLPDVLSDLEASLDDQPEHPELHRLLSDARIRQGDYMAALESLNRSVSLTQPSDE
ncbi:MAG TPA: tetratricopeptide repeat protein [Ktedonobacterales bacterium]|jgi:tetratricopeptide (TPR) repeat protein|nr:tetratricopeptide repeat protein [Ktedonobacterales bacterium]